jgi:hypothetical protein
MNTNVKTDTLVKDRPVLDVAAIPRRIEAYKYEVRAEVMDETGIIKPSRFYIYSWRHLRLARLLGEGATKEYNFYVFIARKAAHHYYLAAIYLELAAGKPLKEAVAAVLEY